MNNIASLSITATVASSLLFLSGCTSSANVCEDVTMAAEQAQQCQVLQRQIADTKQSPLVRTELERRYEQDCINIRYYRDDQQPAVCANKGKLKTLIESKDKE